MQTETKITKNANFIDLIRIGLRFAPVYQGITLGKTKRFYASFPVELVQDIENWRAKHKVWEFSQAAKILIHTGLAHDDQGKARSAD